MLKKLALFTILLGPVLFAGHVFAQEYATGTAQSVVVEGDRAVEEGDIISIREGDGRYVFSAKAYDSALFGVVTSEPSIIINDLALDNRVFVVSSGEAFVKVSAKNGTINSGDFITSSDIPGVGQKADRSGQIVGIALQSYNPQGPEEVSDILVNLDIRSNVIETNVRVNLLETLRSGAQSPFLTPLTSLRYILAALVTAGSFVLGFATFGKASGTGVTALGRNPLAHKEIQRSIILNMVLTAVIMIVGLLLAYLILVL